MQYFLPNKILRLNVAYNLTSDAGTNIFSIKMLKHNKFIQNYIRHSRTIYRWNTQKVLRYYKNIYYSLLFSLLYIFKDLLIDVFTLFHAPKLIFIKYFSVLIRPSLVSLGEKLFSLEMIFCFGV